MYSIRVDNTDFLRLTEIRILMKVSKKKLYFYAGYNGFHGKNNHDKTNNNNNNYCYYFSILIIIRIIIIIIIIINIIVFISF